MPHSIHRYMPTHKDTLVRTYICTHTYGCMHAANRRVYMDGSSIGGRHACGKGVQKGEVKRRGGLELEAGREC